MNGKRKKIAKPGSAKRLPGRNFLVGWLLLSLIFCPAFPGGRLSPVPLAQMARASGDYGAEDYGAEDYGAGDYGAGDYGGSMGDPGYMDGGYDYYSQDSDGDGWPDEDESNAGTDPYNPASYPGAVDPAERDSDGDGLTDDQENNGFVIEVDTWVEYELGYYNQDTGTIGMRVPLTQWVYSDPGKADTDGDLLPDGWEIATPGFNPTSATDGLADPDFDGLGTGQEWRLGTDWQNPDSDGDGLLDGVEVLELGTNPNDPADPADQPDPLPAAGSVGGGGGGAAAMDGGGGPGGSGGGSGTAGSETIGGNVVGGTPSGGGTNGGGGSATPPPRPDGGEVDSGANIRLMGRIIQTFANPVRSGNSSYVFGNYSDGEPDPSSNWMSEDDWYDSDTWIEDYGWATVLDPLWNSHKTLVEGDHCTVFEVIKGAHATAVFPDSAPSDEKGWGDYTDGRIEARAIAAITVGGNLGQSQTNTYYEVEATKMEVRLLASAPVEQEVSRSFLKGTKLDGDKEDFKVVTLTIKKGKLESERIVLDPEIILDKTSEAHLIPVEVVPDYNRDGRIDDQDRGKVTKDNPWRWWVNDDNDSGEYGASADRPDVPEGATYGQYDCQDDEVDGIRDLVDFFPLHLDLRKVIEVFPSSEYQYFLRREGSAGRTSVGALWYPSTHLDRPPGEFYSVGGFLRNLDQATDVAARQVEDIISSGVEIPETMLEAAHNGKGVVFLEGKAIGTKPLVIEIRKQDGSKIVEVEFPLHLFKVEQMYRHVDLRTVPLNPDGSDAGNVASPLGTQTGNPAYSYPDSLTNGKYFVFVHGYNVNEVKARGWFAEIFKRLHQMGSKARFVGVSWRGDAGLGGIDYPANSNTFMERNANYHKPVFFAFQTGDALKDALQFIGDADMTIAAHSLGNMVVSHAIAQKNGLSPSRYYMINAAVAAEAYDSGSVPQIQNYHMVEKDWKPQLGAIGGSLKATAARWYALFDSSDGRSDLKWVDRFKGNKDISDVYHFYSSGEEVLQNPDPRVDSADARVVGVSGIGELLEGRGSWVAQEYVKGTDYSAGVTQAFSGLSTSPSAQAGWGFNKRYYTTEITGPDTTERVLHPPTPAKVAAYFKEYLKENPVFRDFQEKNLTDPKIGNVLAKEKLVKYHVLASAIPALSYAAGSNSIGGEQMKDRRFDMQTTFKTNADQWPTEGHDGKSKGGWLHSDFYGAALSHVYKMYEKMIELGTLDDESKN